MKKPTTVPNNAAAASPMKTSASFTKALKKWAANEWVNVQLDSEDGRTFQTFAQKWYDAGLNGKSELDVKKIESDFDFPPFLEGVFYNIGKEEAKKINARAASADNNSDNPLKPAENQSTIITESNNTKEGTLNEKPADTGADRKADEGRPDGGRILEELPAEDVQKPARGGNSVHEVGQTGNGVVGESGRSDRSGTGSGRSGGNSEGGHIHPASGEVKDIPDVAAASLSAVDSPRGSNFVIGDSLDLPSGEKTRYKTNVEAIKIVKNCIEENRFATAEEQLVLSKYVGWGGIDAAFDARKSDWANEYSELKSLLTDEEYKAARASTLNAHYTSIDVIKAMYDGLRVMGFKGGRLLEIKTQNLIQNKVA